MSIIFLYKLYIIRIIISYSRLPDFDCVCFEDSDNFLNVFVGKIQLRIQNLEDHDTLK